MIIGLMEAGKTTVADAVARHRGWPMRDSDRDIEAAIGRTGREVAASGGVDTLHRWEERVLLDALDRPEPQVVAAAVGWWSGPPAWRRWPGRRWWCGCGWR
ncbi:MAG: hypothetical protein OEW29_18350, partial [Acidimicrobiia bacterium]|nr:hypothetical protein [Acidimicrobiia bacterium]